MNGDGDSTFCSRLYCVDVEETTQFVCCTDTIGRDTIALTDATVIEQELESCRQLVELEPESKCKCK